FAQDRWSPRSSLTVDVGLRFDSMAFDEQLGVRSRVVGPRIGVAWTPTSNWVLRGGAGIFPDRIPLATFERALTTSGANGFEQIMDAPIATSVFAQSGGGPLGAPLQAIATSIYTARRGSWNASSRQLGGGVERAIGSNTTVGINGLWVEGHRLARTI